MTAWRPTSGQRQVPRNENRFHRLNTDAPRHGGDRRGPTCSHYNRQSSGKKKHLTCQHHIGTMSPDHESDKIARVRVVGLKLESPPACHTYCPSSYPTIWNALLCYGFVKRPRNRMVFVGLCRIKKTKGLSALKTVFCGFIDKERPAIPVAAAASVPSSLTSTNALCTTSLTWRPLVALLRTPKSRLLSRKHSSYLWLSRQNQAGLPEFPS